MLLANLLALGQYHPKDGIVECKILTGIPKISTGVLSSLFKKNLFFNRFCSIM